MELFFLLIPIALIILLFRERRPPPPSRSLARPKIEKPRLSAAPERTSYTSAGPTSPQAPPKRIIQGRAYVIDGDSIKIKQTEIRLFGVDAPEMNHPFGKKAKWALVALCKGQDITAEIIATDTHERTVAKCTLEDGRDLSAEMVKQGLALDWPKFSNGVYRELETPDARKKLWLAAARQKGHMHVWKQFEASQAAHADTSKASNP